MKNFKRTLSLLLVIVLMIAALPLTASAYTASVKFTGTTTINYYNSDYVDNTKIEELVDIDLFKERVISAYKASQSVIDVSDFKIRSTNVNFNLITSFMFYNMPESFHIEGISGEESNGYLTSLIISSDIKLTDYTVMYNQMVAVADILLEDIENNTNLTELEKALLLHDRLALWNEYDTENFNEDTIPLISHTAYGALANRISVCDGYAKAYIFLLNRAGVRAEYISSDMLVHAWNIIFINDIPYHVDITWDDSDNPTEVSHENFLRSTNGIKATGHTKYGQIDYVSFADDTTYDNYFWQDIYDGFQLANNDLYYIDIIDANALIKKYDNGIITDVLDVTDSWPHTDPEYHYPTMAQLGSNGELLFYSAPTDIYSYNPANGDRQIAYTPELTQSGNYIWNFKYEEDFFVCYLGKNYSDAYDYTLQKQYHIQHTCDYHENIDDKYHIKGATCISSSIYYKSCTVCGKKSQDTFSAGDYNPNVHQLVKVPYKPAQIGVTGIMAHQKCIDCGRLFIAGIEVASDDVILPAKYITEWKRIGDKWKYQLSDGTYITQQWAKIKNVWYYFDADGWMQTGWIKTGGRWYYLNSSGAMQTGWVKVSGKWYYLNASGAMQTGWQKVAGKWYYLNSSGAMQTGWIKLGSTWYYLNSSGAMVTGRQQIGGKWYYFNSNGKWVY
ncbi:MAG: hypothetical protein Q4B40_02880 [Clostridia bacterium]|nr:hypothetical protein [Clostridia bacterium]